MPFLFSGGDFRDQNRSPLGDLLTGLFGQAAQSYQQAYQDKRKDQQFQQELALRKRAMDLDEQRYNQAQAQQKAERENFASMMAPDAAGKLQLPATSPTAIGAYLAQHQARMAGYQKLLSGMSPEHQATLTNILQQHEEKAKHEAFSEHAADILEKSLRGMQGMGAQGPTQGGSALNATQDPTYAAAQQQHAINLQGYIQALRAHQVKDPEQLIQAVGLAQSNLEKMRQTHSRAMQQAQMFQQENDMLRQQLAELHQVDSAHGGRAVAPEYMQNLEDRIADNDALIQERMGDMDTPTGKFRDDWRGQNARWWGKIMQGEGTDRALKELDHEHELITQKIAEIDKFEAAGRLTTDQANQQIQELLQQRALNEASRQELLQGGGQPEQQPYGPTQGGAPTPARAKPISSLSESPELVAKVAELVAAGKDGDVPSLLQQLKIPAEMATPQAVSQLIEAAKPQAKQLTEKLAGSGSATLRAGAAKRREAEAKDAAAVAEYEKAISARAPASREEWIKQVEALTTTLEDEMNHEPLPGEEPRPPDEMFADNATDRAKWARKGIQLLRRLGALRGYAPATEDELKQLFGVK